MDVLSKFKKSTSVFKGIFDFGPSRRDCDPSQRPSSRPLDYSFVYVCMCLCMYLFSSCIYCAYYYVDYHYCYYYYQ